jgi:predicted nucleotidyltransferase
LAIFRSASMRGLAAAADSRTIAGVQLPALLSNDLELTMPSKSLTVADIKRGLDSHRDACADLGVESLEVFGSIARGDAGSESDIDFLVDFKGGATLSKYMGLKSLLEQIFERKIDLITRQSLRPRLRPYVEKDAVRVA